MAVVVALGSAEEPSVLPVGQIGAPVVQVAGVLPVVSRDPGCTCNSIHSKVFLSPV